MALDMNPEIRAQWCAALRPGDYPQTCEALRRLPSETDGGKFAAGYCCLGVLTDLYLKAGNDEMAGDDGFGGVTSVWEETDGILPKAVAHWAGLPDTDPELAPYGRRAVLVNDGGATFAEIADLIDGGA